MAGKNGTIHTIYEEAPDGLTFYVYYRSSKDIGMGALYAGVDPNGKAHIAYSLSTDVFHPQYMINAGSPYPMHQAYMMHGSIAEVDLDGGSCSKPREVFLTELRNTGGNSRACDGFDLLTGYFDQKGLPHFAAQTSRTGQDGSMSEIDLVADGKQTKFMDLPQPQIDQWPYPPVLLHDAQGKDHLVVYYKVGDHHTIRDYVGGPGNFTILKNLAPVTNPLVGFQASQGPSGTMTLVVEASEKGLGAEGETWINVFDGKTWRTSTQVTNFHKLSSGTYRATGSHSSVATTGRWAAGPLNAATIDSSGHFLLLYEGDQSGSFGVQGAGVQLVSGDTKSPKLFFHRF